MAMNRYKNRLLQALSEESLQRLKPKAVAFEVLHALEQPGEPILSLFFIAAGIPALMGSKLSVNWVYTQIAGPASLCR